MRKHLLIIAFGLMTSFLQAQIVNIPDANFKYILILQGFDSNNDGQIQKSEIVNTTRLDVPYSSIKDLTGIEAFTNLDTLNCNDNNIEKLDLSKNAKLTYIDCSNNNLDSLDLSSNTTLNIVACLNNNLKKINTNGLKDLTIINCSKNQLSKLEVNTNTSLINLYCNENRIDELDLTNNLELGGLSCENNQLTSLSLKGLTKLNLLYCAYNFLSSLDLVDKINLLILDCRVNQLQELDVTKCSKLNTFYCSNNLLTYLDVRYNNEIANSQLTCESNPNLIQICINFKQVPYAPTWNKDAIAKFSTICDKPLAVENNELLTSKTLIRILTPLGQELQPENATQGLYIYQYSDGSTRKIAK